MLEVDEIKGNGNSLDFGARKYDSRIGRWLSVYPLELKFTGYCPNSFAANSPITIIATDGKDYVVCQVALPGTTSLIDLQKTAEFANKYLNNLGVKTR